MEKTERTLEQIDSEIRDIKEQLKDVHGTETEVYARIVGYYRAVRNWNKGKRDEFNNRKLFTIDESRIPGAENGGNASVQEAEEEKAGEAKREDISMEEDGGLRYEFFMRKTCPNCPPVKEYMERLDFAGKTIDVDTDGGLREAAAKGVFSAPTVIFYSKDGSEIGRGHSVEEIKAVISPVAEVA